MTIYYAGNQWVVYDKSSRQYTKRNLPGWFPRQITNKFAEKVNDIIASIHMPKISWSPTDDKTASVALSSTGSGVTRVLMKEANVEQIEPLLKAWLVITGNAFLYSTYDEDDSGAYGSIDLPGFKCPQCGHESTSEQSCPQCPPVQPAPLQSGQGGSASEGVPQMPQEPLPPQPVQMQPATLSLPKGKILAEVVPPFEFYCDPRAQDYKSLSGWMRVRAFSRTEAEVIADSVFGPGSKDKIGAGGGGPRDVSQLYMDSLSYVTSSFGFTTGLGAPTLPEEAPVRVTELWHLPTPSYPKGLYAIRFGTSDELVKAMPLPSKRKDGRLFLPIVHFGFDIVPGRFWRKTRLDDLVYKQNQRNLVEAMIMLIIQRMGSPGWLIPRGSQPEKITGAPGIKILYTAVSAGGTHAEKPERFSGENIPQTMLLWLNKIDDDMERVAGTFFLQGGDTPPGVHAASALAYLGERAQQAMSPLLSSYEHGWAEWAEQALEIFRTRASEPRISVAGGQNRWETERLMATDLEGSIEAQAEAGSSFPQSQASQRESISQLIQMRIINPSDPMTAYNILQHAGMANMAGAVNEDFKIAASEFDGFLKAQPPQVDPVFDNHMAHFVQHSRDAKSDKYRDLPPEQKAVWTQHALQHQTIMAQQAAAQMQQAGAAGAQQQPAPPQPQQPSGTQGRTIPGIKNPADHSQLEPQQHV